MAFCGKCGSKIEEGVKFCPSCGAVLDAPEQATVGAQQQTQAAPAAEPVQATAATGAQSTGNDAQDNKVMAILAYFGPLVLIPIFAAKESPFARYHSNQGLVLLLACIAYNIANSILSAIILAISWRLHFITSLLSFVSIIFTVLAIIGIINACKGEKKPLPLIGSINLLK